MASSGPSKQNPDLFQIEQGLKKGVGRLLGKAGKLTATEKAALRTHQAMVKKRLETVERAIAAAEEAKPSLDKLRRLSLSAKLMPRKQTAKMREEVAAIDALESADFARREAREFINAHLEWIKERLGRK